MKTLMIGASVAALLALAAPVAANAEVTWYGNLGYSNVNVDPVDLGAVQARVGAQFNPFLGADGDVAFGVADDSGVKLKSEAGIYGVVKFPGSDSFDVCARAGYASADFKAGSLSGSDDGAAYGAGAQYFFDAIIGVRVDYTRYDFAGDADVWAISYARKF